MSNLRLYWPSSTPPRQDLFPRKQKGDPSSRKATDSWRILSSSLAKATTVQMGPLHVKSAEAQMLPLVWRRGSSSGVILFIPSPKALVLLSLIFTRSPGISVSKYITCLPLCEHESIYLLFLST
ncbi:hypothetical protein TNCV_3807491 [Trichonephila clavipes]|nr:hypothetical protein TNCV_3807491 [Trichonephila clavipes]